MVARTVGARRVAVEFGRRVLDAILPPRCLACGVIVDASAAVCGACWSGIGFIVDPLCQRCGRPFEFEVAGRGTCGRCLAEPPVFHRARSAVLYDDGSRSLLLRFKHGDGLHMTGLFGAWITRAGAELLADADLLMPVPLHRSRLFARRYNQAAVLTLDLASRTGVMADVDSLLRTRRTPSQGALSRSARDRNVRGAFRVAPGAAPVIQGRRIVLVDDVFTSGATVSACARALHRAGAEQVDVLTIARVG